MENMIPNPFPDIPLWETDSNNTLQWIAMDYDKPLESIVAVFQYIMTSIRHLIEWLIQPISFADMLEDAPQWVLDLLANIMPYSVSPLTLILGSLTTILLIGLIYYFIP